MSNAKTLARYCESSLLTNRHFEKYMKNNPNFIFQFVDSKLFNESQKELLQIQKNILSAQKLKMRIYESEIRLFQESQIPYVGLKGYFIQKAYYPPEYIRLFGDIDIQVEDKIGYAFYKMLKQNGYKIINEPNSPIIYQKKLLIDKVFVLLKTLFFKHRHHAELEKTFGVFNYRLTLDLHGNLFLTTHSPKNKMIQKSIVKTVNGVTFKIFSPEDNLVFLMYHTIKHIGYVNLARENLAINLERFYDVAQIISLEKIDWDIFVETISQYKYLSPLVSLYMKMFSDIFPNIIPQTVIDKASYISESTNFHWKKIYTEAMKMKSEDLILGDYHDIPWLYEHCENTKKKNIEPDYIWIQWAIFYFKIKFSIHRNKQSKKAKRK